MSNMLNMYDWVVFAKNEILGREEILKNNLVESDLDLVCVYTMCYQLSKMIRAKLYHYLSNCNVKEEVIPILDMKNEYLYIIMLICKIKKNYAAKTAYKEGKPMNGKPDIKGLQFTKSDANQIAAQTFHSILMNDILVDIDQNIDILDILIKLNNFEKEIRESLRKGESKFLKPASVKDEEAYDDLLKITGYRAALFWNYIYEDEQIVLPDNFYILKLKILKPSDLDLIPDERIRKIIEENIFNNEEKRIKSKGFYVMALPKDKDIPEWCIPCIDEDLIIEDIMSGFMSVISALGVNVIRKDASSSIFSNYISI